MLVGFTGAQSTGKTTLLQQCKCTPYFAGSNWSFVDEVTRKVQRAGNMINECGDDTTQLFILSEHLNNHIIDVSQNLILDRCILDGYIYTDWLVGRGMVNEWVSRYAYDLMKHLVQKLDIIFYTQPEDVVLVNDGVRSTNHQFRQDIIDSYERLFTENNDWMDKLVRLNDPWPGHHPE